MAAPRGRRACAFLRDVQESGGSFSMKTKIILWAGSGISAVAFAIACSSSSSPPAASTEGDAGGSEDSGSSTSSSSGGSTSSSGSSSGGVAEAAARCKGTSDCASGQVCCGALNGTTPGSACGPAPCAALPVVGAIQLCQSDTDCTAPATCGPNALLNALDPGQDTCNASDGGTSSGDGGTPEASTGDAGDGG